ncbi:MAG TPA: nuclear transport factor 2 family protein [Polyangia bacterium]|jgi:uncharacterized protein (TIGR02246 family)
MDNRATEQEVLELEKEYWRALMSRDGETLARLTDETCIVAGAQGLGKLSPREVANMVEGASYKVNDFRLTNDVEVQLLAPDVAVVAYRVHENLTVDGKEVSLDAADTSTWVRRDGRWRCALHTETLAGDPFGRDRKAARAAKS